MSIIIKTNMPEELKVGGIISTCTSEFEYDSVRGTFDNKLSTTAEVEVEHVDSDYSQYVAGKSCNGGCYGYDYYRITSVVSIDTVEKVDTIPEAIIYEDYHVEDILYEIPMEDE